MSEVLKTRDLFEAALAMAKGLAIASLEVDQDGGGSSSHPRVTFVLEGPGARQIGLAYRAGKAEANVALLRMCVDHLKKRMWAVLDGSAGRT